MAFGGGVARAPGGERRRRVTAAVAMRPSDLQLHDIRDRALGLAEDLEREAAEHEAIAARKRSDAQIWRAHARVADRDPHRPTNAIAPAAPEGTTTEQGGT